MSGELGRALRWPLWSWRNLTITAALMLALLAVVGRATDGQASPGPAAAPTTLSTSASTQGAVPSSTSLPTPRPTTTAASTSAPPASGPVTKQSATAVAGAFVRAWSSKGASRDAWHAGMEPWASPELLRALASTDPAQVPADRVTGDARLTSSAKTSATVLVPTDGGDVLVTLTASGGGWKARDIAPADAPPGAETPSLTRTTPGT